MPQRLKCRFGAQDLKMADESRVQRTCIENLVWANYNGMECATRDTAALREIAMVREIAYDILE